jgi:hypothetical protein
LCGPNETCDIAWGLGAAALAIASGVALAAVFMTAFTLKKLVVSPKAIT